MTAPVLPLSHYRTPDDTARVLLRLTKRLEMAYRELADDLAKKTTKP